MRVTDGIAGPRTTDRRNAFARVRNLRELPRARRPIPCISNICAHRTLRSRRATGTSGRHARRQYRRSPSQPGLLRPLISSSLALLTLPQPLQVYNGPPDQFLNSFTAGRRRCRIPFEKEPPLLHHFDPCPRRFHQHLVFEATEMRLRRGDQRRGVVRRSPPHLRLMSTGHSPATVQVDRVIRHANAPKALPRPAFDRTWCHIADPQVILRCPGARFQYAVRYLPSQSICLAGRRRAFRLRFPGRLGTEPNRGHGARPRSSRPPA